MQRVMHAHSIRPRLAVSASPFFLLRCVCVVVVVVGREGGRREERGREGGFTPGTCCGASTIRLPHTFLPGSHLNKDGLKSIVVQAVCDVHRRVWDLFVGCPGSNNDINVMNRYVLCGQRFCVCVCACACAHVDAAVYLRPRAHRPEYMPLAGFALVRPLQE